MDYGRLEQMQVGEEAAEYVAPRSVVEEQVAGIWKQILGVEASGSE